MSALALETHISPVSHPLYRPPPISQVCITFLAAVKDLEVEENVHVLPLSHPKKIWTDPNVGDTRYF